MIFVELDSRAVSGAIYLEGEGWRLTSWVATSGSTTGAAGAGVEATAAAAGEMDVAIVAKSMSASAIVGRICRRLEANVD